MTQPGMIPEPSMTPPPGMTTHPDVRPFSFTASDEALADLRRRVAATSWPDKETVADQSQGVPLATMQADTQINAGYVRQLSRRVIDGKEDRARAGYHNGQVPFGYLPPKYPKAPDGAPSTWRPPRTPVRADPADFPALVRIGELAAQGWLDSAIADELAGHISSTPRFGERLLTKDTIAAIRRMWFPREFAPGSGHGTIETPSGELIEGKHPAAWPYDLWQRMVEAKAGQYRRPRREAQRRAHEFSRIIVCAGCRRALRADAYKHHGYYRDTSLIRKLPCDAFGSLSVRDTTVIQQFGQLLASVHLPVSWREAVAKRCAETSYDTGADRVQARRADLEAEQKRLVQAFAKGYLAERDLDAQIDRLRTELQALPPLLIRSATECTEAALVAGATLADMAGYWDEALPEERRDIVWALLTLGGLIYDLERRAIVGLLPRSDMVHVLALGLMTQWEQRGDGLWLRPAFVPAKLERSEMTLRPDQHTLGLEQREEARQLIAAGKTLGRWPRISASHAWPSGAV